MELKQYILPVLKWWWLVVLSVGIAALFSAVASLQSPRIYQTSTTLMVGQVTQDPNPSSVDFQTTQQLAYSYVQIASRQPVLQGALDTLTLPMGWGQLASQTSVGVIPGTQLIEIRVIDTDPNRAKILADAIAMQLIAQSPTPSEKGQAAHRQFVDNQLKDLETQIVQTKAYIIDLERSMASESSARRIQDFQSQIAAKQTQLNIWQSNYATLLAFVKGGTNFLSVIEPASVPFVPISSRTDQNILVACAIGLVLSVAAAYVLEYLDDTIKTPADIQRVGNLVALGAILRIPRVKVSTDSLVVALWSHRVQFGNHTGCCAPTSSSRSEESSRNAAGHKHYPTRRQDNHRGQPSSCHGTNPETCHSGRRRPAPPQSSSRLWCVKYAWSDEHGPR